MQFETERPDELTYCFKITFPLNEVRSVVQRRLADVAKSAKMSGFRPGKVPMRLVQQKYGDEVWGEAFNDKISECYMRVIKESGIRPASVPRMDAQPPNMDDAGDGDFQFVAEVEVAPEFELTDFTAVDVEAPVVNLAEQDVDTMIERLRTQMATYSPVVRAAADGDRLTVVFDDAEEAQLFGAQAGEEKHILVASEKQAWTAALTGAIAGDTRVLDIPQPGQEDGGRIIMPGQENKPAGQRVTARVTSVDECVLPSMDEAFFKQFGASDMADLRVKISASMEREVTSRKQSLFRDAVSQALLGKHQFQLPKGMVQSQIEALRQRTAEHMGLDADKMSDDELFREQAERNVKLGLIMDKIINSHADAIKVDNHAFEEKLREVATQYNESDEVVQYYRKDRQARQQIEQMVLEDKLFAWLTERVRHNEKAYSFEEIMSPPTGA